MVGFADIVEVLAHWNTAVPFRYARGDANGDLVVGFGDIVAVLARWGAFCE